MKQYPHIISKLFYEPLVITRARHRVLCQVVESHMNRVEAGESEEFETPEYTSTERTAIIPVHGVLVNHASDIPASSCGCGLDRVSSMIDMAVADPGVNKIVFDFRSPGGGVTGVAELGRKIAGIVSKQTIAFTDDECCSGAMWLAAQCRNFYATSSATVGSIGVWCAYWDMSKAMEKAGENLQVFQAGKFKTMGGEWKPLSKEEGEQIQRSVDKIHKQFKEAMQTRREVSDEHMQGQIFDGMEALEIGLIDGLVDSIEEIL